MAAEAGAQQKALLISQFLRFVEWPASKFVHGQAPYVIGVVGSDDLFTALSEAIQTRQYRGRPVSVRRLAAKQEAKSCHILVFSDGQPQEVIATYLGEAKREKVLSVGQHDQFLKLGGVINLVPAAGSIRYELSDRAARREGLRLDSNLHRWAVGDMDVGG